METSVKTVLITGGASGMGLLLGQCYAKEGANIVLADIDKQALDARVEEIRAYHENVIGVQVDVRNYEEVVAVRDAAVERFGSIDILINCAGGAETRIHNMHETFHKNPIEIYDFGIDVNLKGAMYFDHAVMAQMAEQNSGVIIHLGSITGEEGSYNAVAYAASKSALMYGVTKSIAQAGAPYNVRCVCIAPGPVMTRPAMANMKTLLGRAADTQEIVDMIMYAASEKCAFLNGVHILMDGGRSIMFNKT